MKPQHMIYMLRLFSVRRKAGKITFNSVYILLTFNYKGNNIFSFYHFLLPIFLFCFLPLA